MNPFKGFLNHFMDMAGEKIQIVRNGAAIGEFDGVPAEDHKGRAGKHVSFLPEVDIREGDAVTGRTSGLHGVVVEVKNIVAHGEVVQRDAYYETSQDRQAKADRTGPTFNIGTIRTTTIATTTTATNADPPLRRFILPILRCHCPSRQRFGREPTSGPHFSPTRHKRIAGH